MSMGSTSSVPGWQPRGKGAAPQPCARKLAQTWPVRQDASSRIGKDNPWAARRACRARRPPPRSQPSGSAITRGGSGAGGRLGGTGSQLPPDQGGHLGAEELDGLQHLLVGDGADGQLEQEAIVPEELVLVEDLLGDL